MKITNIIEHLKSRDVDFTRTNCIVDEENCIADFFLYNLTGQIIGYQRYNPNGSKANHSNKLSKGDMKYYTYITKNDRFPMLAVYGLETYTHTDKYLFITEGIFDCIKLHNQGLPAIAVIANNPSPLKSWLRTLPQIKVVVKDNDGLAGDMLSKFGDIVLTPPDPYKDLGDMPFDEVYKLVGNVI